MDATKRTGAAGEVRFVNEYIFDDRLVRAFAQLQQSARQRGVLLLVGCVLVALGAVVTFTPQALHWLGLVPVAVGCFCWWYRSNLWRPLARRTARQLASDAADDRFRRVTVTDDALVLSRRDGATQTYPFSAFTDFQLNDTLFAVVFGKHGVAVPVKGFRVGDAASFGQFLARKRYPAGEMGPATPNR